MIKDKEEFLFSSSNGSYKIGNHLFKKLVSNKVPGIDGKTYRSVSNAELSAIMYFTTISDSSGFIKDFKISDLKYSVKCSQKHCYNIVYNLQKKGFISVTQKDSWTGLYDIKLLDNDFSKKIDYKKRENHYLNTNHFLLQDMDSDFYDLTLPAKKIFLIMLKGYDYKHGYSVSTGTLKSETGICNRSIIKKAVDDINSTLENESLTDGKIGSVVRDRRKRLKYGSLFVKSGNNLFVANTGIDSVKDTYFKRKWRSYLENVGIIESGLLPDSDQYQDTNTVLDKLFSVYYSFFKKGIKESVLDAFLLERFDDMSYFDEGAVKSIGYAMEESFQT